MAACLLQGLVRCCRAGRYRNCRRPSSAIGSHCYSLVDVKDLLSIIYPSLIVQTAFFRVFVQSSILKVVYIHNGLTFNAMVHLLCSVCCTLTFLGLREAPRVPTGSISKLYLTQYLKIPPSSQIVIRVIPIGRGLGDVTLLIIAFL